MRVVENCPSQERHSSCRTIGMLGPLSTSPTGHGCIEDVTLCVNSAPASTKRNRLARQKRTALNCIMAKTRDQNEESRSKRGLLTEPVPNAAPRSGAEGHGIRPSRREDVLRRQRLQPPLRAKHVSIPPDRVRTMVLFCLYKFLTCNFAYSNHVRFQ